MLSARPRTESRFAPRGSDPIFFRPAFFSLLAIALADRASSARSPLPSNFLNQPAWNVHRHYVVVKANMAVFALNTPCGARPNSGSYEKRKESIYEHVQGA